MPGGWGQLYFLVVFGIVVLLTSAGCAVSDQREDGAPTIDAAERVAQVLSGSYAGTAVRADGDAASGRLTRLEARVERVSMEGVSVRLEQRTDGREARNFRLILRPTALATRLEGSFSPLGPQDKPVGTCPLEVSVRSGGFVARTSAATCRFGRDGAAAALVKEIAHDGERLVIGDRVLDPGTEEARTPDRVLELERVRRFVGWAGVRDTGESWRVAESVELQSDGVELAPEDAGGMTLAVVLELAPHRVREDQSPVLRLRVFDRESGELLGQSWADSAATRIGVALPDVQVGLRLSDSR
ncbi:MAG: hypothetical protein KGY48_01995 [Wenzhouxiangellaceae bacterium]|nr:hypothetical protein [Wenzhouxiangellaceae bacterium]MBS3745565.1 hypothetical protein [Wenzhouxiangellaceae bacterium]